MNKIFLLCFAFFFATTAFGDTPPLASVNQGDGNGGSSPWSFSLPPLAANSTLQTATNTKLDLLVALLSAPIGVTGTFWQTTQPVSGTFWQATQPVSGTFWQATQPVSLSSIPLGTDAALASKQDTGNASAASIDSKVVISNTDSVTVVSSALPDGAATATAQTDTNDRLGNLDAKIVFVNTDNTTVTSEPSSGSPNTQPPSQATMVGGSDGSNLRIIKVSSTGVVSVDGSANLNASGSAAAATVSTVISLSAPANAVGFILMNLDTSTTNLRWAVGRTASATLGQQLQPGRDTGFVPVAAAVSIVAESGTVTYDIQWVIK